MTKDFYMPSKGKSKTTKNRTCWLFSQEQVPVGKRTWTDVEPGKCSFSDYEESKKITYLLRHSQQVHREEDGAVHFWKIKGKSSESSSRNLFIGPMVGGKYAWQQEEEIWKDSSTVLMLQELLFISELFRDIQDAILLIFHYQDNDYSEQLLPVHKSCRMCVQFAFYHQLGVITWRSKFEQKTDSILSACGSYWQKSQGSWCDRLECTASCTIPA